MSLSLQVLRGGPITAIAISGDVDAGNAHVVRHAGEDALATARYLVLDLHRVTFFDCAALSAVLHLSRRAAAAGGRLQVTVPSPPVALVLDALAVNDTLQVGRGTAEAYAEALREYITVSTAPTPAVERPPATAPVPARPERGRGPRPGLAATH
ncbi:STAS domain-containing protein [Kineococcus sp. SYSU DK003]|uniref:STAS domain-containing protein n=1 Tax=Kineococcus sp. SYSU DK003 TaxID=3383124 RepID=UPI003D7E1089